MRRTKKHTNFLAILLSLVMAFSLLPAFALAAENSVYFQRENKLEDGKEYVIAVETESGDWYALKGASSSNSGEFGDAVKLNFEGELVIDPDALAVWKYSASKKQLSSSVGDLYFASTGVKYQTDTARPVNYDGNMYADVTSNGNTLKTGDKVYFKFDLNANRKFTTTVSSGGTTVPSDAAQIKIFKKLTAEEKAAYDEAKEVAELENLRSAAEAQAAAIAEVDPSLYDADGLAAIEALYAKAKDDIHNAGSQTVLDQILTNLENDIANVPKKQTTPDPDDKTPSGDDKTPSGDDKTPSGDDKTSSGDDKTPVDEKVTEAKDAAVKELDNAKAATGYDAEQKAQIQTIIKTYIIKINSATTVEQINALKAQCNKEIKALPTAAQKKAIKKTAVKLKKIKVGKKKMTIRWKKAKFDGYQIKYKIKGKKKWKTKTVKKASATKKVVKKLKKGKKYKVKVRGYKLFGVKKDVKVYGKFSKVKTSKKIK